MPFRFSPAQLYDGDTMEYVLGICFEGLKLKQITKKCPGAYNVD